MKVLALDYGPRAQAWPSPTRPARLPGPSGSSNGRASREDWRESPSSSASSRRAGRRRAAADAARRARLQAAETERFVVRAARALDVPDRRLRRAVHDCARRAGLVRGARGRARGGAPPAGLPRLDGRTRGMSEGACSPRRRLVLLAAGLGLGAWLGSERGAEPRRRRRPAPPPLERLRIIFPEGFTVREMGQRVAAVREIAIRGRGVTPRLTRSCIPRRGRAREAAARRSGKRLGGQAGSRAFSSRRCTSSPSTRPAASSSPTS